MNIKTMALAIIPVFIAFYAVKAIEKKSIMIWK